MEALLHLPPENNIVITPTELAEITGAGTKALQVQWLQQNGWKFAVNRHGEPRVGRLYANLKLGGLEMSTIVTHTEEWQPNAAAIGS